MLQQESVEDYECTEAVYIVQLSKAWDFKNELAREIIRS